MEDWIRIGITAASGLLAALLTMVIIKKPRDHRVLCILCVGVIFGLFNGLSQKYIFPHTITKPEAAEVLLRMPVYKKLKEYEPAAFNQAMAVFDAVATHPDLAVQEGRIAARQILEAVIAQNIKNAPDDALHFYMNAMVEVIEALRAYKGKWCLQYLYPAEYEGFSPAFWPTYLESREMQALVAIIEGTAVTPAQVPAEAEVSLALEAILLLQREKYGEESGFFNHPIAAGVESDRLCKIIADLYREVLKSPPSESGPLLRFMFAQPNDDAAQHPFFRF